MKSNPHTVSCGIPQGSVFGPLLFNICINDIINATRKCILIMYADDTTMVSHLKFTPYYNNEEHSHNLRSTTLRLPMTGLREFFVQFTKYQFLRLIRDTTVIDLNRTDNSTIYQYSAFFKYSIINRYDPVCVINHCYVCG